MEVYHRRSIAKAMSYRIFGSLITAIIVYIFSGKIVLSIEVGGFELIAKMFFYYLHERGWEKIPWGLSKHPLSKIAVKKELSDTDMDIIRQKLKDLGYM